MATNTYFRFWIFDCTLWIGALILIGFFEAHAEEVGQRNPVQANEADGGDISSNPSANVLKDLFIRLQKEGRLVKCGYYKNCFEKDLSNEQRNQIAIDYRIIDNPSESTSDVSVGLVTGATADIPGIGTAWISNRALLKLGEDAWYWEIGACSTNRRVFVNATTGQGGLEHSYVYCGGVP